MKEIYVDADACPVKDEILKVAARHGWPIFMVSNSWMRLAAHPLIERIVVSEGPDVADDWIAERVGRGDIAVTSDIPLASRCVKAGAAVLRPTGKPLNEENIGMAVAVRDLNTDLREAGGMTSGPAGFTKQDRSRFLSSLDTAIQKVLRDA